VLFCENAHCENFHPITIFESTRFQILWLEWNIWKRKQTCQHGKHSLHNSSQLNVQLLQQTQVKIYTSKSSKRSTHYLNDTIRFDVSSKGPLSEISVWTPTTKVLCSKRRICLYRLGSE
jgi:hypothetical protein